jgi:hypothetical protein
VGISLVQAALNLKRKKRERVVEVEFNPAQLALESKRKNR